MSTLHLFLDAPPGRRHDKASHVKPLISPLKKLVGISLKRIDVTSSSEGSIEDHHLYLLADGSTTNNLSCPSCW